MAQDDIEPKGKPCLSVVTCIKNEGEDLVEWLCFHRQVGVSHFVIYDNLSTDTTARILDSVPFRADISVRRTSKESPQKSAFADALRRYRNSLDWVAFIDGDEFIVPLGERSLQDRLLDLNRQAVDGIGINWRIFGSSRYNQRPPGLLTESFVHRAPDSFSPNKHVKSIVRIAKVEAMVTQHYFRLQGSYLLGDGTEPPANFKGVAPAASYRQGFAIHHYITKSREQCRTKIARGRPKSVRSGEKYRPPWYWNFYDRNEVEDRRAAQVIAPIRDEVIELRDRIGRD